VLSVTLVAVTVTVWVVVTVAGTVYRPAEVMAPVAGLMDHVTAVLWALVTVAVNCCVWLIVRVAVAGATLMVRGGSRFTIAVPVLVPSTCIVAVTVTVCGEAMLDGAVYNPPVVRTPVPAGAIDQFTADDASKHCRRRSTAASARRRDS